MELIDGNRISREIIEELTAEELRKGKWEKLRQRNESWDHLVYGEAAILKPPFAQSRSDMRWVPRNFRIRWPEGVQVPLAAQDMDPPPVPVVAEATTVSKPLPPRLNSAGQRRRANPFTSRRR